MKITTFCVWLLYKDSTAVYVPAYKEIVGQKINDAILSFAVMYHLQVYDVDLISGEDRKWIVWYLSTQGDFVQYEFREM